MYALLGSDRLSQNRNNRIYNNFWISLDFIGLKRNGIRGMHLVKFCQKGIKFIPRKDRMCKKRRYCASTLVSQYPCCSFERTSSHHEIIDEMKVSTFHEFIPFDNSEFFFFSRWILRIAYFFKHDFFSFSEEIAKSFFCSEVWEHNSGIFWEFFGAFCHP